MNKYTATSTAKPNASDIAVRFGVVASVCLTWARGLRVGLAGLDSRG